MRFLVDIPQRLDPGATPTFAGLAVTGGTAATVGNGLYLAAANVLGFASNGAEVARIFSNGRLGIGTGATDSGNGILQLGQHTDRTGGLGLGTDISLCRLGTGQVAINNGAISFVYLDLYEGSASRARFESVSGTATLKALTGALILGSNNTTAVTIDTSQNSAFAGTIKPQLATTAGAPAYVKGALYFDTTLNKLRVGGVSAWETITSA